MAEVKTVSRRALARFVVAGTAAVALSAPQSALLAKVITKDGKPATKVKSMYSRHWPLRAEVNLRTQRMELYEYGKKIYTWKISSGQKGYGTPQGTYSPKWLHKYHRSNQYESAPMPNAVFFHGGYAVHGTEWTSKLGTPASKGCVRLHEKSAAEFYKLVLEHGMKNTRINITYPPAGRQSGKKRKATQTDQQLFVADKVQMHSIRPKRKPRS